MTATIVSFYQWVLARFFWRPEPLQLPRTVEPRRIPVTLTATALALEPEPDPEPVTRPARRAPSLEQYHWHFKSVILDRLDEYFVCMRRLRRYDPDSYDYFARVGMAIPADRYADPRNETQARETITSPDRPGHGGMLCGGLEDNGFVYPSFVYFQKIRYPVGVERVRGDTYALTAIYDDRQARSGWVTRCVMPVRCHLVVQPDGAVRLLRERCEVTSEIVRRTGARRERIHLTSQRWQVPTWVQEIAGEHHETAPNLARFFLIQAIRTYQQSLARLVVRARRGDMVAAFGIDLPRAKYFFADRELELARDGRRKRIFHAVTEHERHTRTKTVHVKYHYRGSRHFDWNGTHIDIVFPQNNYVMRMPIPAVDATRIPDEQQFRFLDGAQLGNKLAGILTK